jgi:hypothetical protein
VRLAFIGRALQAPARCASCAACSGSHQAVPHAWRIRPESPRAGASRDLVCRIRRIEGCHRGRGGRPQPARAAHAPAPDQSPCWKAAKALHEQQPPPSGDRAEPARTTRQGPGAEPHPARRDHHRHHHRHHRHRRGLAPPFCRPRSRRRDDPSAGPPATKPDATRPAPSKAPATPLASPRPSGLPLPNKPRSWQANPMSTKAGKEQCRIDRQRALPLKRTLVVGPGRRTTASLLVPAWKSDRRPYTRLRSYRSTATPSYATRQALGSRLTTAAGR